MLQRPLLLALSLLLVAYHASVLVCAAADARQLPQAGEQPAEQQPGLPPLIAALSALRDPLALSIAPSSDVTRVGSSQAAAALAAPGTATVSAAPLETLRPAAAAALARQHENPSAPPMTDDDIAAINILLGREGPPSRPYCYDTGLPANASTSVPHLLTFGNRSTSTTRSSSANSSMQSVERLSRMSSLGPLSWLARTFAVSGDSLVKLRITQQLQLILQDAICDSAASAAELPPNQVVTFASSNLTLSLDFAGVDWDAAGDTAAAASGAQPPAHKGLLAVQKALQQLSGNFDPGHTLVSFEEFPRGPTRAATRAATASAAKGQKQRGGAASAALLSGAGTPTTGAAAAAAGQVQPPTAANSARKLLLRQDLQQQPGALMQQPSSSSDSSSRALLAADGVKTVYVRMYGADPMNLTTLVDRLGNCSAAPAAAPGRMPQMPAGQPLVPSCAEVFRQHFELQGVRVQPGGFSVAPKAKPAAAIELSVAIGLTLPQQAAPADSDAKASAWLNSTAMQDILGTFNLSVASSDADFLAYLRDPQSGRYPSTLSGLNVSSLLPALFQQVLEASKDLVQQQQQPRPQPQQQPQGSSLLAAPTALSRSILAGIIVAVVASVLALLGVVVLLLRRRSDRGAGNSSSGGLPDPGAGPNRRRKRRPRVYHNKYLPDGGPVLGRDPESDAPTSSAGTAAAAEGLRHTLERGDSVMSQVHMELDDAADEQDQEAASSSSAAASASASPSAAAAAAAAGAGTALSAGVRAQQRHWRGPLQRQEGEAGSGGSSVCSRQHLLGSIAQPSDSSASTAAARVPDDASVWESSTVQGSVSGRTVSAVTDLTAHSSVLSPWASSGEQQQLPQGAGCADSRLGGATKHRLAVVSQAAPPAAAAEGEDAVGAKEGPSCGDEGAQDPQQQQQQQAACGSLSMASAFAAMNAQLDAAVRAGSRHTGGGAGSSGGGSSSVDSASAIQPLGMSCWHKDGHVSGFYAPDAAAGSSGGGGVQRPSAGGGLVSPFAAAIQLAKSVASDEV